MTKHSDFFAALTAPFEKYEVRQRKGSGGQMLDYVTLRTIQNRLDNVAGPENWKCEFFHETHGLRCRLSIRLPDGEWLGKEDGGGAAGMQAEDDNEKSAYSDSMKRAAVQWGIGRYLYKVGSPSYSGNGGPVEPPPEPERRSAPANSNGSGHQGGRAATGNAPRTGKALFAWTKEQEQKHQVGLLKYLNSWAKLQEWPARMIDWDAEQVQLAHAEAVRKLQSVGADDQPEAPAENPSPAVGATPHHHAGDDLPTLRIELTNLVFDIAQRVFGSTETPMMRSVLTTLSQQHPEKKEIYSLKSNGDPDLLRWYIGECVKWLAELEGAIPV